MMSKADDTAKKVCDAMVAEHAKRPEYFQSGEVHKYRLKDTVWVERHHKNVLSRHRQQSWYIPGVILLKTGHDVHGFQVGNNKTVERDHTQLLQREPDPQGRSVTFEFTADAFDSNNNGEEDEYTAERILSDKPDSEAVAGGSPYRYPVWLARALNSAIYDVKWDYEGYRTTARIYVFYVKIAVFYTKFPLLYPIL